MPSTNGDSSVPRQAWLWFYLTCIGAALVWGWRELPGYVAATEYQQDDWEWLNRGSSLGSFLHHVLHPTEIVRPLFHALYVVAYRLTGLDARPLAFFLALGWLLSAAGAVWMFHLARVPLPIAVLGVVVSRPTQAAVSTFFQVSYQGLTLSRLLLVSTCIVFLRGEPRAGLWCGLMIAGLLTHEQYLATLPTLAVLLAWRDGIRGLWARLIAPGSLRSFAIAFAGLAVVRVLIFWFEGGSGTHAPGFGQVLRNVWGMLETVPPLCSPVLLAVAVLALIGTPLAPLARPAALCAGIAAVGYAPYVFQKSYFASYFANITVLGAGLLVAFCVATTVEVDSASQSNWRRVRSLAVLALLLVWAATPPPLQDRFAPGFAEQMIDISTELIDGDHSGREIKVVFLEDPGHGQSDQSPPYFHAIGLEHGRSGLHTLLWPAVSFRFERRTEPLAEEPGDCEMRLLVQRSASEETPWTVRLTDPFECPVEQP